MTLDPEQITQIFCPYCRKGVPIRGAVPPESDCPHCEKRFPTAEFAAPRPTVPKAFVSSHPPGRSNENARNATHRANATPIPLNVQLHSKVSVLNAAVPPMLSWGLALFAMCLAPFIDGSERWIGPVTAYSSLALLYLLWIQSYGATKNQKGLSSFARQFTELWTDQTLVEKRITSGRKARAISLGLLGTSCFLLGGSNLLALLRLACQSFSDLPLTTFNGAFRMIGLGLLMPAGGLWLLSQKLSPTPSTS